MVPGTAVLGDPKVDTHFARPSKKKADKVKTGRRSLPSAKPSGARPAPMVSLLDERCAVRAFRQVCPPHPAALALPLSRGVVAWADDEENHWRTAAFRPLSAEMLFGWPDQTRSSSQDASR